MPRKTLITEHNQRGRRAIVDLCQALEKSRAGEGLTEQERMMIEKPLNDFEKELCVEHLKYEQGFSNQAIADVMGFRNTLTVQVKVRKINQRVMTILNWEQGIDRVQIALDLQRQKNLSQTALRKRNTGDADVAAYDIEERFIKSLQSLGLVYVEPAKSLIGIKGVLEDGKFREEDFRSFQLILREICELVSGDRQADTLSVSAEYPQSEVASEEEV